MKRLFLAFLVLFFIGGCATEYGELQDGREYYEYHIKFDREEGKFYIPLEQKTQKSGSLSQTQP